MKIRFNQFKEWSQGKYPEGTPLWKALIFQRRIPKRYKDLIYNVIPNFKSEIEFWDKYLSTEKNRTLYIKEQEKNFPKLLFALYNKHGEGDQIKVLDVGSGPLSTLSFGANKGLFSLIAVDPLSEKYINLLKKYNIKSSTKLIKGKGEKLLKLFPKEEFDVVYSCNALDHTQDVQKCLKNMVGVLKRNGFLFLEGHIKEGSYQNWKGLHKHDLIVEGENLVHYDNKNFLTNLTYNLGLRFINKKIKKIRGRGFFSVIYQKKIQ